jgi:hypothetical protein
MKKEKRDIKKKGAWKLGARRRGSTGEKKNLEEIMGEKETWEEDLGK